MGNFLDNQTALEIVRLHGEGTPKRKISRLLGISTVTVAKYLKGKSEALCKCGKNAGHKGWCVFRYQSSLARQAFHARRRGETIQFDVPPLPSLSKSRIARRAIWLGDGPHDGRPIPCSEHYGVIGEIHRETQRVKSELKDDVRQHMIVAVFEGRLSRDDIPKAVTSFVVFYDPRYRGALSSALQVIDSRHDNELDFCDIVSEAEAMQKWEDLWAGVTAALSSRRVDAATDGDDQ